MNNRNELIERLKEAYRAYRDELGREKTALYAGHVRRAYETFSRVALAASEAGMPVQIKSDEAGNVTIMVDGEVIV